MTEERPAIRYEELETYTVGPEPRVVRAADLRGLTRGMTGGLSSEEYVRRLRDGRPRRPWLILAVLIVVLAVVFITQIAAPRGASEPPSTAPALLGAPSWEFSPVGQPREAGLLDVGGAPQTAIGVWNPTVSGTPSTEGVARTDARAGMASGVTSRPAQVAIAPALLGGTATWYCGHGSACTAGFGPSDMVAAIDPTLGIAKGTLLTVSHGGRSVLVRTVDVCACSGRRLIDLTSGAFSRLAPLSAGVITVTIETGTQLPNTDTAP